MLKILLRPLDTGFLVNPFYLYVISFATAILLYSLGWSELYPELSVSLLVFLFVSFIISVYFGMKIPKVVSKTFDHDTVRKDKLFDLVFYAILLLGIINVWVMGYIPFFDKSKDYREFGVPVIDPVFNSLSIFFSVFLYQTYLTQRKPKYLIYVLLFILINFFLFRRASIIWISFSSLLVYILQKRSIKIIYILISIFLIPVLSFLFGSYGNLKSNLDGDQVMEEFAANERFVQSGAGPDQFMTYIYETSPLANLQLNVDNSKGFLNNSDFKDFLFYCLVPQSIILRLEKKSLLVHPDLLLIHPHLIVGTVFLIGFHTLGWLGMIILMIYILIFIKACLYILHKWNATAISTYCILVTMVSLLPFSNFLNRLDVIMLLFIYPVAFHYIFNIRILNGNAVG